MVSLKGWPQTTSEAWNKEYEQAGADVQENLRNWAKQQEADLAEEQAAVDETWNGFGVGEFKALRSFLKTF